MVEFNKEKQIEYWRTTAFSDMNLAEIVIQNGKILHGLFCFHLTIEKAIKAFYELKHNKIPPYIHNLRLIAEQSGLYELCQSE